MDDKKLYDIVRAEAEAYAAYANTTSRSVEEDLQILVGTFHMLHTSMVDEGAITQTGAEMLAEVGARLEARATVLRKEQGH